MFKGLIRKTNLIKLDRGTNLSIRHLPDFLHNYPLPSKIQNLQSMEASVSRFQEQRKVRIEIRAKRKYTRST